MNQLNNFFPLGLKLDSEKDNRYHTMPFFLLSVMGSTVGQVSITETWCSDTTIGRLSQDKLNLMGQVRGLNGLIFSALFMN